MFRNLMTSVSGVRGIVGEGLTPEVALLWAMGFGTWAKGRKIVIARDTRPTGEMFVHTVKAGLMSVGCDIDDVGVVPTPVGALAVERRGAGGGIIITASHNPQAWNALKFVHPDGRMLSALEFKELEQIVCEGPISGVLWDKIGRSFEWRSAGEMYLAAVLGLGLLNLDRIRRKKYRVVFDGINGAGSVLYPILLEALGCEVIRLNCNSSGIFPHPPEPNSDNIADLCRLVKAEKCHLGFAVDPDGDRLAAVDETGHPIGEETTLALAILNTLAQRPGPVVINCLTSQMICDIAHQFNQECYRTKVGEANVAAMMREIGAVVGGEGNGGVMLAELHLVRDAGVGMALILNEMSKSRRTLSAIAASLPQYKMFKATYPIKDFEPQEVLDMLAEHYDYHSVSRIDGVRVEFDQGWAQARASNTEPILRIYSEAADALEAEKSLKEMLKLIDSIVKSRV